MNYLDKIKEIEFNILKYISEVCEENNLRYYLFYGTLLGAVRHKGFIPWDDDIDIAMPRKDYEKLREILFSKEDNDYKLISWENTENYPFIFPKVIYKHSKIKEKRLEHLDFEYGVYVDIFVMDGLPENNYKKIFLEKYHKFLYQLIRYYYSSKKNLPKPLGSVQPIFSSVINVKKVQNKVDSLYLKYDFDNSKECRVQLSFTFDAHMRTHIFGMGKRVEFEGQLFYGPSNSEEFLISEYGDYMSLPKESDRVSCHTFSELEIDSVNYEVI